ncbi:MBL fold metallo-hydrolase [Alkalimonas collagenimarina]|uniref:MBL fold metallo-hydrolase n=1 Tax=Alkalimonas collagenimarina TaxID=400390 RepID=A0ABT9GX17_9GAMM|nr:MBL fold metallo-hydrolase [Alkalimonas collagenimarina]MDP4535607.1 MBL fold metallo-hydrolase [Alkalimonas collagenimarina]
MTMATAAVVLTSLWLLQACSSPNAVQQLITEQDVIEQVPEGKQQGMYRNLYRGKQDYPVTCEDDCYPPHPEVACKSHGQDCQFIGDQTPPELTSGFLVHWVGHASFLIKSPDGQQLLFDPVMGQFDRPVSWAAHLIGLRRPVPAGLPQEQLAASDAVLYSHLHYDHFSHATIRQIGTEARYYVPVGMADYMPKGGYQVLEKAWYSSSELGELTVHMVPAHHFNSRMLFNDDNKAKWAGWLIEHQGNTLFFAGDTGYSPHFSDIQQRYGDIDICLIPVASYHHDEHTEWYRYVHTTPEDALVAADDLGCKVMIPWGYGNASWQMGDHSSHSPLLRLLHMQQQLDSQVPLLILNEGDSVQL